MQRLPATLAPLSTEPQPQAGAQRATKASRTALLVAAYRARASQEDKRKRVASIPGYPQEAATWVTCDFEAEDFLARLVAAGFDPDRPSVILWEGVTMYLGEEAIRRTLRRVTTACEPHTVLL